MSHESFTEVYMYHQWTNVPSISYIYHFISRDLVEFRPTGTEYESNTSR